MDSNDDYKKRIKSNLEYYAEQSNMGWLDLSRKFVHSSEVVSKVLPFIETESGKKFREETLEKIIQTQMEKQRRLDEYAQGKGAGGSLALSLTGGLARNASDASEVALNYITNGAIANVVGNAVSYAWEEASLYGRNILTEWDNGKDIMGLLPGAVMGAVGGAIGNKYKPADGFLNPDDVKAPRRAPIDASFDDIKSMDAGTVSKLQQDGNGVVNLKYAAEIVHRQEWDFPQGNYMNTSSEDWHNFLSYASDVDRRYKAEIGSTTIFDGKKVIKKGTSSLKIDNELDVAIQPLLKNTKKHLEQIASEDAYELFGGTAKPFGNQLYDLSESIAPKDFVEMLQGRSLVFDESGQNKIAGVLKDKLNEFIGIKAGLDDAPNIKFAYYLDTFYNKQDAMIYLKNLVENEDMTGIKALNLSVGEKVTLTKAHVDGIAASMEKMGKVSKITEAGTYSMGEYPLEMTTAFWHGVNSTTLDAQKKAGTFTGESKWAVGIQWGNAGDNLPNTDYDIDKVKFGNYAQFFEGFERKPYEIISNIYSTVSEHKAGLDNIRAWIHDITADDKTLELTASEFGNSIKGLNSDIRGYMKQQLRGLNDVLETGSRYKPNFNIDPNNPQLTSKHFRKSFKNFLNYKFLYGLNYGKENPMNASKLNEGARSLGWETGNARYLRDTFIEPTKMHAELALHWNKIKDGDLSQIADPKVRRRMEIFMERRVANDVIWNDPSKWGTAQKTMHTAGDIGGFGQGLSDVSRIFISEWGAKNYMQDILPTLNNDTSRLKLVLQSNGIDGDMFTSIKNRLKGLGEEEFNELIWGGKRATTDLDIKIQNLYEQVSDIFGREFNPFEKVQKQIPDSWAGDMMMLYKRYSMGAFENAKNKLFTYYGDDGRIRKRFDLNDSFSQNAKRAFKGMNTNEMFVLAQRGVYTYALANGVGWATGKLYGTGQDLRVEAKLEALTEGGEVLPFVFEAMSDLATDYTGIGILFGASTPFGGLIDSIQARFERAGSAIKLSPEEKVMWFISTSLTPEHIARGIDNLKFDKSIPSRMTTASSRADMLWRVKYQKQARIQQIQGELPIEKVLGNVVDWGAYFVKNPEKAYEITGADPNVVDKDTVIIGATGIVEVLESKAENEAIIEIMSDNSRSLMDREGDLKNLGLDINSQLNRLEPIDRRTLNAVLAYKQIRNPEEILMITQALVKSHNRKEFLRSLIPDEELGFYRHYSSQVTKSRSHVNELIKNRKNKSGIEAYLETLEIADKYIRQ